MSWSTRKKYNGGMTASVAAIPPFFIFLGIFKPLIPAPADGDLPICLIPIIIPLLFQPVIADAVFETPERAPAADRVGKFLTRRASGQGIYEIFHNAAFMNVVLGRETEKTITGAFNQFFKFLV